MDNNLQGPDRKTDCPLARKGQAKGYQELGYITLLLLILLATLSAYGLEMYVKAHGENKMSRREISSRQAIYGSEGGIEWAKVNLQHDPDFSGGRIQIGEGTVNIIVKKTNEQAYTITSAALYGQAQRRLKVELERVEEQWVIRKYQEIHGNE